MPSGGGGLVSTLRDYFRLLAMLMNGGELEGARLVRLETVRMMTTNQLASSQHPARLSSGEGYGLGVGVQIEDQRAVGLPEGSYGWSGGTGPLAWVDPAAGAAALILYQGFGYSAPAKRFRALALGSPR